MRTRWMRRVAIGFLLVGVFVGSSPRLVAGQPFSLTQITNTTGAVSNFLPAISANGTRIVFLSSGNLVPGTPGNADGNTEVFLFDTITRHFTQITNSIGSVSSIGGPSDFAPSINAAGTRIAFTLNRNPTPANSGNGDGNDEIFLFDTATGLITQITNTVGCSSVNPSISAAGTRIAFRSTCDLTPGNPGNPGHTAEIFLFDTTSGLFTQITHATGPLGSVIQLALSGAGTRIVFVSTRDLTPGSPGNADNSAEIFLFDTTTGLFTQITNTTAGPAGNFVQPSINADGTRLAFISDRNLAPGNPGNPNSRVQLFLFDTTTGLFTQITNTTGDVNVLARVSLNGAGTRIAFAWPSSGLTLGNPGNFTGNEQIFLFDTASGLFTQLTNSVLGGNFDPSISGDGTRLAFAANRDLTPGGPGNPDGNFEIFVAASPAVSGPLEAIPTLSGWMQLVVAALLLATGLFALRRAAHQPGRAA